LRGAKGSLGKTGRKGAAGKTGAKGAQGREPLWRRRLLEQVDEQITRVDRELGIQLKRIAQIQQELDELRSNVQRLMASR
jgi:archaellum component FlaC